MVGHWPQEYCLFPEIKECHGLEKTSLEEIFSEKRESLEVSDPPDQALGWGQT